MEVGHEERSKKKKEKREKGEPRARSDTRLDIQREVNDPVTRVVD